MVARWDGRPFPGKCTYNDCPNQASTSLGRWTGGAPGVGEWEHWGRCDEHVGKD
jgi:hypothetical protein